MLSKVSYINLVINEVFPTDCSPKKTNLNLQPIKVLDKYIVHDGTVNKEISPREQRPIYLYFDYDFYLDMLIDVAKYKNKKELNLLSQESKEFLGPDCQLSTSVPA